MNQPMRDGGNQNDDLLQAVRQFLTYPVRTTAATPAREREERGTGDLKDAVEGAIGDVLGWRRKPARIDGVLTALEQAFEPYEEHGRVLYRHKPGIARFHSELDGGVVGAQASLHVRATEALNRSLPLLETLTPLIEDADEEIAAATKSVIATEFRELVVELGRLGGPRVSRVDQLWEVLLGESPLVTDPDLVDGELGRLRSVLGLEGNAPPGRVNVAGEEQQLTNFRIITDDLASLRTNWERDKGSFDQAGASAFLGIQLVQLERRLAVVAGSVGELRAALDAVLIDADERRTRSIRVSDTESILLEDLLEWTEDFATQEGPRLVKDGGRLAITGALESGARRLRRLVEGAIVYGGPGDGLGLGALSVQEALRALERHLLAVAEGASDCRPSGRFFVTWNSDANETWSEEIDMAKCDEHLYRIGPLYLPTGTRNVQFTVFEGRDDGRPDYPRDFDNNYSGAARDDRRYVLVFDSKLAQADPCGRHAGRVEVF